MRSSSQSATGWPCVQDTGVNVYAGQPGMASTDFFNPKKFDILKISAVAQYLAQKVSGLTPAQGAAPVIMCCLMAPDELIGKQLIQTSVWRLEFNVFGDLYVHT